MKTTANPERCSVASGSPLWWGGNITPSRKGWYITRTEDGFISWRAWGNGAWWKQIKGGWIESYTGDGCAMRYDWQPQSRQSIELDHDKLPDLANIGSQRTRPAVSENQNAEAKTTEPRPVSL